jgi:hypothetical protein
MRNGIWMLMMAAVMLVGCATPKGKIAQPTAYTSLRGELGKVTATLANGSVTQYSLPWDATWEVKNGDVRFSTTAFKIEPIIGAACFQSESGLEGSPWAGIRFVHVGNVGLDVGFDKKNFSGGADWLHHGLAVGPSVFWPYLKLKPGYGLKAGFIF